MKPTHILGARVQHQTQNGCAGSAQDPCFDGIKSPAASSEIRCSEETASVGVGVENNHILLPCSGSLVTALETGGVTAFLEIHHSLYT